MNRREILLSAFIASSPAAKAAVSRLHPQLEQLLDGVLPVVKHFHSQGMLSPHAASIDKTGSVKGSALTSDGTHQLSVPQAIDHFMSKYRKLAGAGEIVASGVFYHSSGLETSSGKVALSPATTVDACVAIVGLLEHASEQSVYFLMPYSKGPGGIQYSTGRLIEKPASVFAQQ